MDEHKANCPAFGVSVQSEQSRGERRWYWLERGDETIPGGDDSHDRRVIERRLAALCNCKDHKGDKP